MTVVTPKFGMGASVLRREDAAFIQGQGRYTDDIQPAGVLHGYVLRSPVAKASFTIGSTEAAKAAPGVHLVLIGKDLAHLGDLRSGVMQQQPDGTRAPTRDIPILCRDRVNYVGDAVAFVVADSRALAQDAAELIDVDYDGEDAASGTATALAEGTTLVWPELGSNRAFSYHMGDKKKTDAAFARAAHVTRIEFVNNRLVCNYMEPRSAIGEWNVEENRFVLTTGSQGVHSMQYILASLFKIKKDQLRVITPDVGGGFGPKSFVYREYPLVLEAAKRLGRPVKWAGDRTEHFLTDAQGRDLLSAILYGTRISLTVGVLAVLIQAVIGVPLGLLAGYTGGQTDTLISRAADIQLSLSSLMLAIIALALFRAGLGGESLTRYAVPLLVLVIGLAEWPYFARTARAATQVEAAKDYVRAGRALGASSLALMGRHILPNISSPLIVVATTQVAGAIMAEAALSFLGLGMPVTKPSLGTLIRSGYDLIFAGAWWVTVVPGLVLIAVLISINVLGDALRDALDPRRATR